MKVSMTSRSGEEGRKLLKDQAFATPEKVTEMVGKVIKSAYDLEFVDNML